MEERQKGIVLQSMTKEDEELETMATLVAGSTDEGNLLSFFVSFVFPEHKLHVAL